MKPLLLLAALLALSAPASAQVTASGSVDLVSAYVWRGIHIGHGPAVQPAAAVNVGEHVSFGVWASAIVTDRAHNRAADELNLVAAYATDIGRAAAVAAGLTVYVFPGMGPFAMREHVSPEVFVSVAPHVPFEPQVTLYYDANLAGGFYGTLGAGHAGSVLGVEVHGSGLVGYNHSQFGAASGLAHAGVAVGVHLPAGGYAIVPEVGVLHAFENTGRAGSTVHFGVQIAF